jgi:hypothetical protein
MCGSDLMSDERTAHTFSGEGRCAHRFPTLFIAFMIEALIIRIFKHGTRWISQVGLATINDQTEICKPNLGTLDLCGSSLSPRLAYIIDDTLR